MAFWLPLLIGLVLMVVAYLIMPKPKQEFAESKDLDNPTAQAGMEVPVVFGTKIVKGLNVLWYGDKSKRDYEVNV